MLVKIIVRPTQDADIGCLGDRIQLAHKVAEHFRPNHHVSDFKNFGTAQIKVPGFFSKASDAPLYHDHEDESVIEDIEKDMLAFEIEFVGARRESYAEHSSKPSVIPGTLEDDQTRRDFT